MDDSPLIDKPLQKPREAGMRPSPEAAPPRPMPEDDEIDLLEIFHVLWRGKRWIALGVALGFLASALYILATPPTYEADALVRLKMPDAATQVGGLGKPAAASEIEALKSRNVLLRAMSQAHFDWQIEPVRLPIVGTALSRLGWGVEERLVLENLDVPGDWLGEDLTLTVRGEGSFTLLLPDGRRLEGTIGTPVRDEETGFTLAVAEITAKAGRSFVIRQLGKLEAFEEILEKHLSVDESGRGTGVLGIRVQGTDRTRIIVILDAIIQAYVQEDIADNLEFAELETRLLQERIPRAEQELRQAEEKLAAFRQMLATSTLQNEVEQNDLIMRLVSEVLAAENKYRNLQERLLTLQSLKPMEFSSAELISQPAIQPEPVAPRTALVLALGLLLGGMGGSALALGRNWGQRPLRDPAELERLGLPVMATVDAGPEEQTRRSRQGSLSVPPLTDPVDPSIEAIRTLRTNLLFWARGSGTSTVTITSPHPAVGKSFIAANLAVVAAQAGQRVCLIDADLRRGHLRRFFDAPADKPGLAEILAGGVKPEEALIAGPVEGLSIIETGRYPPNPSELLMRPTLAELVEWCAQNYDLTIFDAPPVLAVTDPVILGRATGATLLVARHDVTPLQEVEAAIRAFETAGVPLTGAVLSGFDPRKARNRYGYGYGYRYAYGKRTEG